MSNCERFIQDLDAYVDAELDAARQQAVESHVATCKDCTERLDRRKRLCAALRAMPVESADTGFLDTVVSDTVISAHRNAAWFWSSAGIGGAIAAGVIAWLVLVVPADLPAPDSDPVLRTVSISLDVEKTVRLTFRSGTELQGAAITVDLPAGVEIVGYDGLASVRWTTTVNEGVNILELPLILRSGSGGPVLARLEHEGRQKSFEFAVAANGQQGS